MGGAYFEPVVSAIPDRDALGQTKLLSNKIVSLFGKEAQGFWTAERAWEPHLPEVLADAGVSHTFIDDVRLESAGLDELRCFLPYEVESRGKFVTIFPILKKLRYTIPFRPVSATLGYLKKFRGNGIAVYGDDGEKFGAWPSTFDRVYKERWLEFFFKEITANDWIKTVKISDYLREFPPWQRIYLPASAYSEMMEWAIPIFSNLDSWRNPKTGKKKKATVPHRGFWRMFLAKYPESARMYAKMLNLSKQAITLESSELTDSLRLLMEGAV